MVTVCLTSQNNLRLDSNELYELLVKLEKCRQRHEDSSLKVKQLKTSGEALQEKVWQLNHRSIAKSNRCSDGRLVEAVHKYSESTINGENLKKLDQSLLLLKESVSNDNCINYYLSQFVRLQIENHLTDIFNGKVDQNKFNDLRTAISALFAYQRRCLILKDKELLKMTLDWLMNSVRVLHFNSHLKTIISLAFVIAFLFTWSQISGSGIYMGRTT